MLILLGGWAAAQAPDSLAVMDLRCEYAVNPLGVDTAQPRVFWKLQSSTRGQKQTAYQVLVATTQNTLAHHQGDLWDSGKVISESSIQTPYAGAPLKSSQRVFWKIRVWDKDGKPSTWSQPASWTMGILRETDWQARWISAEGAQISPRKARGYHASEAGHADDTKWVQVDLGRALPVSAFRLHPMRHENKDGFGFPIRFKVETATDAEFTKPDVVADHTGADYKNPGYRSVTLKAKEVTARYVRVTVTQSWRRDTKFCFALQQLEVISGNTNAAVGAKVTAKDSVENYGWGKDSLTDGLGLIGGASAKYQTLLVRHEFSLKPGLQRAVVHVCGLGQYELSVNGQKVGADLLAPGWTKYDKTCLYDTHDITPMLQTGRNAVGLLLGNGMYNVSGGRYTKFKGSFGPLKAIAQLHLEYADGTSQIIGTGPEWQVASGPITFSCIYGGEDYDARLEPKGWSQPGFAATQWFPALCVTGPGGTLRGLSSAAPPLRAFDVLQPVSVKELSPRVTVYDLGQNAPLMPRFRVHGPPGTSIKITPAELLKKDGPVDRGSVGGGEAYWKYTLSGDTSETWFPKFWYHGCRYLQVELEPAAGNDALPAVESLEGVVVHSASPPAGEFSCSNELFNRIRTLIRWAQRANMVSVLTDCPHRERLGWLEEYHLNGPSLRYEWDLAQLFTKSMNDMADSQTEAGLVPDIAPEYVVFNGGFRDSPEWGSAFLLVPWQQYEWTGDLALLRRHYAGMKRYVIYLGSKATDHIVNHGLGDWYDIGPKPPGEAQLTPRALTATAFYFKGAWVIAQAAKLLGYQEDAEKYALLADTIRTAFNTKFRNPDTHQYSTGSQCANAIPCVLDLADLAEKPALVAALVADVRARTNALTAGDVGFRYLVRALADGGHSEVLFDMNNQSERPGYGYQLKQGATSLTEAWDARRGSSHNHFMLGHILEWFYQDVAGIGGDPAGPGFKRILIKPQLVGDLTWARGSYDSIYGGIRTDWKKTDGQFTLQVTIPPNTTATVFVPAKSAAEVRESNLAAQASPGVQLLRQEPGYAVFQIASGSYQFQVR